MKSESAAAVRLVQTPTQLIANLAKLEGWKLYGNGADLAIEKTFTFNSYLQTLSFVNAVGFIAEKHDHHPELLVQWGRCSVRLNTHDAGGITLSDFECASLIETLVQT